VTITGAQLADIAVERRRVATQAWSDLLGGGASCRLDGSLPVHEGAKLREGESVALGLVVREARRQRTDDALTVLEAAAASWTGMPVPGQGRDWDAYHRGGDLALAELRELVGKATTVGH
jgi:hypothetical protein